MTITGTLFRLMAKRSDRKRDAGLTSPESVARFDDIRYGLDAKWNVLDVYRPKDAEGKLPVIVSVHGGGWIYGDKDLYQYYCMSLAEHGFSVVNFSYRLAPKHKFPAALEDVCLAFSWLKEHGSEYGLDTENVFAVGDSAGAHMLGLYCCIRTSPGYAESLPFSVPDGITPEAVALNCGIYRLVKSGKRDLTTELMKDVYPGGGTDAELFLASVIEHVTSAFPPAFVMTAEGDFLASEAEPFVKKLLSLGAEAEYHYYRDSEHVLGHVFHCNIRLPKAQQCNREECEFFQRYLTPERKKAL